MENIPFHVRQYFEEVDLGPAFAGARIHQFQRPGEAIQETTGFFRNPASNGALIDLLKHLPRRKGRTVKALFSACSNGAEPEKIDKRAV